jgi:hypothetical protein
MAENRFRKGIKRLVGLKEDGFKPSLSLKPGSVLYSGRPKNLEYLGLKNAHEWSPLEEDWKLPEDWHGIVVRSFRDRVKRSRTLKVFLDT